jgi:hypothetical protein
MTIKFGASNRPEQRAPLKSWSATEPGKNLGEKLHYPRIKNSSEKVYMEFLSNRR